MPDNLAGTGGPAGLSKRPLWTVVVLLVLAAAGLWGSSRLTWQWSQHVSDLRGTVTDAVEGATAEAGLVPLALLCLAAIAAVVAVGGWLRRIVGAVVIAAGAVGAWLALHAFGGVFGVHPAGYPTGEIIGAHLLAAVAGALAVAAGIVLLARGGRMPRLGARYQSPATARRVTDQDRHLWDALSEGEDPTAGTPAKRTGE